MSSTDVTKTAARGTNRRYYIGAAIIHVASNAAPAKAREKSDSSTASKEAASSSLSCSRGTTPLSRHAVERHQMKERRSHLLAMAVRSRCAKHLPGGVMFENRRTE
jgi:hypothetical protein